MMTMDETIKLLEDLERKMLPQIYADEKLYKEVFLIHIMLERCRNELELQKAIVVAFLAKILESGIALKDGVNGKICVIPSWEAVISAFCKRSKV